MLMLITEIMQMNWSLIIDHGKQRETLQGVFILSAVAGSADGASLDGACDEDVTRLTTPDLHSETFDMNDLSSNAYAVDARRMQLYSHVHPTVS